MRAICVCWALPRGDSKGESGAVSPRREAAGSPLVDEPPPVSLTLVATNIPLGLSSGSVSEVIINLCPSARDIILENNPRDPSQRAFFSLCEGDPVPFKSTPFVQVGEVFWSFSLTRPREKVPDDQKLAVDVPSLANLLLDGHVDGWQWSKNNKRPRSANTSPEKQQPHNPPHILTPDNSPAKMGGSPQAPSAGPGGRGGGARRSATPGRDPSGRGVSVVPAPRTQ